ncbi:MAG TPA: hypothetical protein PL196_00085 [Burkholderiaceae bacterium]|nr:hypothetical protein [Burkholderiaceae bacterium]
MAAISPISVVNGAFSAPLTTMSADDTITFDARKKQLLVFRNPTGGSLTATIDGDGGTTVDASAQGLGTVTVSGGYAVVVGAGLSSAVVLSSIAAYCKGVVHITGAASMIVQQFDI